MTFRTIITFLIRTIRTRSFIKFRCAAQRAFNIVYERNTDSDKLSWRLACRFRNNTSH